LIYSDFLAALCLSQADPTDVLTSVTHYSIDGKDWTSESGATIFEQKVKHLANGKWFHTFSWNYDVTEPNTGQKSPKEICFKVPDIFCKLLYCIVEM
jgi:hypothetical protein